MIKVIKTGINVSKVVEQLKKYPQDWDHQKNLKDSQSLVDRGFADLPISALQLIMGSVKHKDDFVGDSETNIKTPAYAHHSEIRKIIRKHFKNVDIQRCGFLSLPIDVRIIGSDYLNKDFTGKNICEERNIRIVYNTRDHSFSSTSLRERIKKQEK